MHSKGNHKIDGNWQQKYLDVNQVDYSAANKLVADDFLLRENNFKHYSRLVHYILSNILNNYFLQALDKQKIRYQNSN